MTAALLLAGKGRRVVLVEKEPRTAPLLKGFRRQGVFFDTGFHYAGGLGEGEPLDRFFRHLGLASRVVKRPCDPEGFDILRDPRTGFEFRFPQGFAPLREALVRAFPREERGIDEYLASVKSACDALPYLNLEAVAAPMLEKINGVSLAEVLRGWIGDPRLREILTVHTLLYGMTAEETSFGHHASIVGPYYSSAWNIDGGGGALAAAFDAELARCGVDVRCGRGVERIDLGPDGVPGGVTLKGGEEIRCRQCVVTIHPGKLPSLVPSGALRSTYCRRLAALDDTLSALMLFAVTDAPIDLLQGRNLYLSGAPRGEVPGTVYLASAGEGAADGRNGFVAITAVPPDQVSSWKRERDPEGYRRRKEEALAALRRRVEEECPEVRGRILSCEGGTPETFRRYCGSETGGLYGVKHRLGQYNPMPATRIPGLFLAGQAVAAPGVMGAILSAYMSCGQILGDDTLREELKTCG